VKQFSSTETTILVLGDIHGRADAISRIVLMLEEEGIARELDFALVTGDIAADMLLQTREDLSDNRRLRAHLDSAWATLRPLRRLRIPVYFVPGNHDPQDMNFRLSFLHNIDIFGDGVTRHGPLKILGIGGCPRSPMRWPFEWKDKDVLSRINGLGYANGQGVNILLTHTPPQRGMIKVRGTRGLTSPLVGRLLANWPDLKLCVCGHFHQLTQVLLVEDIPVICAGSVVQERTVRYRHYSGINAIAPAYCESFFIVRMFHDTARIEICHRGIIDYEATMLFPAQYEFLDGKLLIRQQLKNKENAYAQKDRPEP
jgi:Icc-related predicted phosphoesterase